MGKGDASKAEKKKLAKVADDKTFGLKNKNKSKAVQQVVKGIQKQHDLNARGGTDKLLTEQFEKAKAKKALEEEKAFLASIYQAAPVSKVQQSADGEDDDPKNQICAFFKAGVCAKGRKCKFSHDLGEEKNRKIDLYTDQREQIFGISKEDCDDTIESWDKKKLEEVVGFNSNKYARQKQSEIVCKFFLDALESKKYGWHWVCPNGYECQYKHALPPGFVMRSDLPKNKKHDGNIEDDIDDQRKGLMGKKGTPLTKEIFLKWKEDRKKRKEKELEDKKKRDAASKNLSKVQKMLLSGRALFVYDPSIFEDAEDAAEVSELNKRDDDEQQQQNGDGNDDDDEGHNDDLYDGDADNDEEDKQDVDEEDQKEDWEKDQQDDEENNDDEETDENGNKKDVKINEDLFEGDEDAPLPE